MREEIEFDQFQKLDIRVGTVEKAEVPEWSHWVMKLTVNFGDDLGKRTIFAGIMKFYEISEIEGKQFPFVVNIAPKRIGPADENGEYEYSQGMMLAAAPVTDDDEESVKPVVFCLTEKVPDGTPVR